MNPNNKETLTAQKKELEKQIISIEAEISKQNEQDEIGRKKKLIGKFFYDKFNFYYCYVSRINDSGLLIGDKFELRADNSVYFLSDTVVSPYEDEEISIQEFEEELNKLLPLAVKFITGIALKKADIKVTINLKPNENNTKTN